MATFGDIVEPLTDEGVVIPFRTSFLRGWENKLHARKMFLNRFSSSCLRCWDLKPELSRKEWMSTSTTRLKVLSEVYAVEEVSYQLPRFHRCYFDPEYWYCFTYANAPQ
jgi:hypothetical protein